MGCNKAVPPAKVSTVGLVKRFKTKSREFAAFEDISLEIGHGEFCVIVGPSGCGKTTLLRVLAGLDRQTEGDIAISRSPESTSPQNAMVFQEASIFPWMTVRQNVEYGLKMRRVAKRLRSETVSNWIQKVGLGPFSDAYPHQLSGGMKQRVSVARAFANDPEMLLMDEPFAALDEQNRTILQGELLGLWEETRKTVVFITHSIEEAVTMADRIIVMTKGPGRIKEVLKVDFPRPRNVFELKKDPRYGEIVYRVWQLLQQEVQAS